MLYTYTMSLIAKKVKRNGSSLVPEIGLVQVYNECKKFNETCYSFVECGVAKGGCLAMMKSASGENNRIYGFDSFEGMPAITEEDLGEYNKSNPLKGFGCVGHNLSGGIESVYRTFNLLKLNMDNVILIKGFFKDTVPLNKETPGEIGVLRLDGDWYDSTKICLENFYDNVVTGGIIIIDDYGHFIGAKKATDEFRLNNGITSPLIKVTYTIHYWIK